MGSKYSKQCEYCGCGINTQKCIVYVYSVGKLDGKYVCNDCLYDKRRRHNVDAYNSGRYISNYPKYYAYK